MNIPAHLDLDRTAKGNPRHYTYVGDEHAGCKGRRCVAVLVRLGDAHLLPGDRLVLFEGEIAPRTVRGQHLRRIKPWVRVS